MSEDKLQAQTQFISNFDDKINRVNIDGVWYFSLVDIFKHYTQSEASDSDAMRARKKLTKTGHRIFEYEFEGADGKLKMTTPCVDLNALLFASQSIEFKEWDFLFHYISDLSLVPMLASAVPSGKYFISHSYKDAAVRDQMIGQLPDKVKPFIFPPINVSPLEFVSNSLIEAILSCDGVICLDEGFSSQSFWVAFEREYALHIGKRVFAYTPSTASFTVRLKPQLDLQVYFNFHMGNDKEIAHQIGEFLIKERFFTIREFYHPLHAVGDITRYFRQEMEEVIKNGGYIITFLSKTSQPVEWIQQTMLFGLEEYRLFVVRLDKTPLPDYLRNLDDKFIISVIDGDMINNNRVDDLIVRLYWLIFQTQSGNLVS